MIRRGTVFLRAVAPPLLFGVILLGIWEAVVRGFDLKPYFLVPPSAIWSGFVKNFSNIWHAMVVSGTNAAFGLIVGSIVGILMAFLLSRSKILDQLITPLSTAVNAIPAFVLVSVFNNMFSTTSVVPRRLMVTLIVFFIVLVNVAKGLRQVDATHAELMRSYAASNWEMLRKVRVPNAVPYLFTALKVAAPLSVIYAYVSEYFGGAQDGLGSRIASNIANSKNAVGWAYVLGACLLGLTFYLVSIAIEAAVTPGRVAQRNRDGS
ncbi:MAG TPA: ABC transporter permease [Ilumatobacteraceae bacterium]|jgi:NitT/TauT family transport system permease protein|nr:ABC transporter permease [Ilumatobacteraceae bacterium]